MILRIGYFLILFLYLTAIKSWSQPVLKEGTATSSSIMTQKQKSNQLAQPIETPKSTFEWKMGLSGYSLKSEITTAQMSRFDFKSDWIYRLSSELSFDIRPFVRVESGASQSLDPEDLPENRIYLSQAAALYSPLSWVKITAGALQQETLHSRIVTGRQTFPEARLELNLLQNKNWQVGPVVSSALPTSSDLSPENGQKETVPQLLTAGAFAIFEESKDNTTKIKLNYFQFSELPQSVRNTSVLRGNTASENTVSETNYNLKYQYRGLESTVSSTFPIFRGFGGIAELNYIKNQSAPEGLNQAYLISGGTEFKIMNQSFLQFIGSSFRIEPDAAVAKYSSSDFFFTNRVGYGAEIYLKMKKSSFRVGAAFRDAGLIQESDTQSRVKIFMLRLETLNENI